ncbi:MAG: dienelactone hydrolase family protein [Pseudomonadales bacterium]
MQQSEDIVLEAGEDRLNGTLTIPEQATAIVMFVHGSGSSRFSPRNKIVAGEINKAGLATLLFDLLTAQEDITDQLTSEFRFNVPLLAGRLIDSIDWLQCHESSKDLPIGLFGTNTGAAAALIAAAEFPNKIGALVSLGGRTDMASEALPGVRAPTLLIVGGYDDEALKINRAASDLLSTEHRLEIVPAATHSFREPGRLEQATQLARDWFMQYLAPPAATVG